MKWCVQSKLVKRLEALQRWPCCTTANIFEIFPSIKLSQPIDLAGALDARRLQNVLVTKQISPRRGPEYTEAVIEPALDGCDPGPTTPGETSLLDGRG